MLHGRITEVKKELVQFATLAETMIERSIRGLLDQNEAILRQIIDEDEPNANIFEINIEELCTSIIAQHEPRARDLRIVLMIYKMTSDIERMADHAVNIADSGLFLIKKPLVKPLLDIPRMAEETVKSVGDAIKSFIDEDAQLARNVCERDDIIDSLEAQIFRELVTFMVSDSSTIERSLFLLRIANNLERVADLATNIAEDVIFMVQGKVIKHHVDERVVGHVS
ncbi:MAG TPA: phosphate signaling complex protein PhoU [Syntrophorhabdaceae bacterium]|nr:phosphate signaling complex protein PhoU [Syntrophorhabdaceae bacterium]